ncbi:hypothetical protein D0Z00_003876 [Geotrichum galactomycetum]|uniref:Uncharacterized protein n=1 Tax=Geotrichum galactomycetum TaxID=27317 RepID=A0ACB6V027_9ASCO|nr:hypothetical protein D0Z00_003876 [Geotrichum candidum]
MSPIGQDTLLTTDISHSIASSSIPPTARHMSFLEKKLLHLSDPEINAISGASAGVLSALTVCPLDVAKTKLQAQGGFIAMQKELLKLHPESSVPVIEYKYRGLRGTISTIFKEEGVRGLYRGVVPITVGYLPTWAIYFVVYGEVKERTSLHLGHNSFLSNVISAITAGAVSTIVTNPIWVIKTRLMTQSNQLHTYSGTIDAFKKMYTNEGILSFYSGLGPALLGLLHVAVHFPLYERLRTVFRIDDSKSKVSQIPQILSASILAKISASTITYPHEVIRTRAQIQTFSSSTPKTLRRKYNGIIQTTRTIFIEEGWRAFYSGLGTNMVRTVPASAVTLMSYEIVSGYLRQKQQELKHYN